MSVPTTRTSRSPFSRRARTSAAVPGAPAADTKTVVTAFASSDSWFDRSVQTDARAKPARPEDGTASGASLTDHRELRAERLGLAADVARELRPRRVHVHVVGNQETVLAQRSPRRPELEAHALVGVLAVVHEEVDLTDAVEQRRKLVLRAPEDEMPSFPELRRHHPARLLAWWDH